jgi:hypothetical protein
VHRRNPNLPDSGLVTDKPEGILKLALMGRSPFQRYRYAGKKTATYLGEEIPSSGSFRTGTGYDSGN